MAIHKVTESGFTTKTTTGKDENQSTLEQTDWDYAADFGLEFVDDGSAIIAAPRLQFVLWNIRNGVSQRINDAHASDKSVKDKTYSVQQKVAQLKRGEMSADRVRLSLYDECLRDTIRDFFNSDRVKKALPVPLAKDAVEKLARDLDSAARYAASISTTGKTADYFRDSFINTAVLLEKQRSELGIDI